MAIGKQLAKPGHVADKLFKWTGLAAKRPAAMLTRRAFLFAHSRLSGRAMTLRRLTGAPANTTTVLRIRGPARSAHYE